ncbi:uncharacterized protein LOC143055288 [Mytilus galloprovincialis]|uniref:uncharacterized protein LOC143055288 n=1 Tax=Mytilus galloprovincialis TaxID=29158 RepID=UPI003F7B4A42
MNRRYKGIESSELKFSLKYSDLNVSKKPETSVWTTQIKQAPEVGSSREMVDTASALDLFLNWIVSTPDLPNFDYAILFSGYNLTYGGSASNTGLSYPSSVCQNISLMATTMGGPVAVVEESFSDIRSIGIAAQELGRSLGARKDFDEMEMTSVTFGTPESEMLTERTTTGFSEKFKILIIKYDMLYRSLFLKYEYQDN